MRTHYTRHQALACNHMAAVETLAACAQLEAAGCHVVTAAINQGQGRITVDRRPTLPELTPGCLRCDSAGAYYTASLHGVRVSWIEPPRPQPMSAGERLAVSLGHISPRAGVR